MSSLKVICFSPVGTSEKIAKAISEGISSTSIEWYDLSNPAIREKSIECTEEDIVLMVFPVYAGRVVRVPRYFFKKIVANGAKAITVVTYGNRAYDDALYELSKLAIDAGFKQVAAAAFVCEHSFDIGLAPGRPGAEDIEYGKSFGQSVMNKIALKDETARYSSINDYGILDTIPGDYPFRTQFRHDFGGPLVPETSDECINCGECEKKCPVLAISKDDYSVTNASKCITCYRCIRRCPVSARAIPLPDFINHCEWLTENYQDRKEIEVFL